MVDFNEDYIENAKMTKINNEASAWSKKFKKPQLHGGVYYYKCNCDLTNGLQDDCRNPNCRSSYTKLTKRTCSCGRSLLKKDSEGTSKEEEKKEVGGGDGEVKESKKPQKLKEKEPEVVSENESKKSKEKEAKDITAKESKETEIKESNTKEPKEKEIKKTKTKESDEAENKENKKPKEKESTDPVKKKESKQVLRKKITTRRI